MTEEEYEQELAEIAQLTNEYNNLVDYRNQLVEEHNALIDELEDSLNDTVKAINFATKVQKKVIPKLDSSAEYVIRIADLVNSVQNEIDQLSAKYFMIKNISTASKKLTELNNEYQKKFKLYNHLRRVALGYVVGVDENIISNKKHREMVEKSYLQNADYWISHCLMATMLWVSDEKEAAKRAVDKAMSINQHKSSLFFLLINLHFGRSDAASKWFEYYVQDLEVSNVGDEIRILLQAYLYNVCGDNLEFKNKISAKFNELLSNVKNETINYNNIIKNHVLEYILANVHRTTEEFVELQGVCKDYPKMIETLSNAEKNAIFAKEFEKLYSDDNSAPKNMTERIRNVLYDLINTYDEAEMQIIKRMDYNEMILKARGDISAAQSMYETKYKSDTPLTMAELMVKLAIPSASDDIDVRVRKFAVSFLCKDIILAFDLFKKQYNSNVGYLHEATIGTFKITIDENNPNIAKNEFKNCYKKNRKNFINKDKKVKILTVFTWLFWFLWIASTVLAGYSFLQKGTWNPVFIVLFAATFLFATGATIWLIFQKRKAGAFITARMNKELEFLDVIIKTIQDWRKKLITADEQRIVLTDVLKRFSREEEIIE